MTTKLKYLSLLIIGLVLAILLVIQEDETLSSAEKRSISFAITDSMKIDKLEVGQTVIQQTDAHTWKINNKHRVSPEMLNSLFTLLKKIEIKRPVGKSAKDAVTDLFISNGIEVKFYTDNHVVMNYTITGDEENSYAMFPKSEPYTIYVPGYPLKIHSLLVFDEKEWRDKYIFNVNFRSMKKIELQYPQQTDKNVLIQYTAIQADSGSYEVQGVQKLDRQKLYNYVVAFNNLAAEDFTDAETIQPKLGNLKPHCLISYEDINATMNNQLTVYKLSDREYAAHNKQTNEWVWLNPKQMQALLINKTVFERTEK